MRRLKSGLIAEGESDVAFLRPLLQTQLERMAWDKQFEVAAVQVADTTTVKDAGRVVGAAAELLEDCDLLFVHHDSREAWKIDRLRERTGAGGRVVGVVPVRETEAWVLAAVCGADREFVLLDTAPPEKGHKWVEGLPDPKAELRRRYRGRQAIEDLFSLVAERADFAGLAEVPAYQSFLQDLTTALKELNFR